MDNLLGCLKKAGICLCVFYLERGYQQKLTFMELFYNFWKWKKCARCCYVIQGHLTSSEYYVVVMLLVIFLYVIIQDNMSRSGDPNDYVVHDPLLEKGKEKFNKMQARQKRREREWAGKSLT